ADRNVLRRHDVGAVGGSQRWQAGVQEEVDDRPVDAWIAPPERDVRSALALDEVAIASAARDRAAPLGRGDAAGRPPQADETPRLIPGPNRSASRAIATSSPVSLAAIARKMRARPAGSYSSEPMAPSRLARSSR